MVKDLIVSVKSKFHWKNWEYKQNRNWDRTRTRKHRTEPEPYRTSVPVPKNSKNQFLVLVPIKNSPITGPANSYW